VGDNAAACHEVVQVYESAAGPVHALRGITLDIRRGAVTAIVGPSGAGKSTLLRLLACLEDPTAGDVEIAGVATGAITRREKRRFAARHIGYVFQTPGDNVIDYLTVEEQVRLSGRMRSPGEHLDTRRLIDLSGLGDAARDKPIDLSAGQQQLLAFASAAAGAPTLIVADEPTADLDTGERNRLVELLGALAGEGSTIVVSTHDEALLAVCDDIISIRNGTFAAQGNDPSDLHTVVDSAGRIQLPPDADEVLPHRRARITRSSDDTYTITPP
jgi:ABC-type lipoprotein export system ATPase subunit